MFKTLLSINTTTFIFIVIIGVFILALLVVGLLKMIQIVRKQIKRNKRSKNHHKALGETELLEIFGGDDNITSIEIELNRVSIKVIDKTKVHFDVIKDMKIGCMVMGNTIKCSSEMLASKLKTK